MIELKGKIWFDPKNVTKKHNNQAEWKRMAMVMFEGDASEYYAWFIKKRYNLILNQPLRGAHISFINDSIRDMGDKADMWDSVKDKYNGMEVKLILDTDVRSDGKHWKTST
jgi:ABC-type phosphate transport system ATPase subunit